MSTAATVLPQGAGYGVVIGIGLFFSALMIGITALQGRYTAFKPSNAEGGCFCCLDGAGSWLVLT
jgi:hypothetical protein